MVLFINASKDKQLDVFLINKGKVTDKVSFMSDFKVSEKLLGVIFQLLNKNKLKFKDLEGIITISGPGPFTSIRISAAIVNALAYALKIPVIGLKNKKLKLNDNQLVEIGWRKLERAKIGEYISPFYDQKPNITMAKK
ncbi:MAG TPA: tRNA (adenosine(37)-N6)-threonylcarbamoyltransferase complex dimerization subunit type 1 TsaB [Candidatus Uhrbacteria bacterium]|nr:tRNA (adenosine(37)-N6)-threonylcarbamoyltransferase complex dimerization subunit type 1 TsaB [Candidatus Uhrbacteria bacterium]